MGSVLLLAVAGALCAEMAEVSASCCAPPEFHLGAPPKPPVLLREPHACEAYKEIAGPGFSTEGKKPVAVGMIIGIIIAFLVLIFVACVGWFVAKKKNLKYQVEPESEQEKQHNFLYNYKVRGWFWRLSDRGKKSESQGPLRSRKKNKGMFEGGQGSEGSLSSTSSESGYCEDAVDPGDQATGGGVPEARPRAANVSLEPASQPLAASPATPDIIASTQPDLDQPKRWSLFGLLPSLKPVLVARGLDASSPEGDDESEAGIPGGSGIGQNQDAQTPTEHKIQGLSMAALLAPVSWIMDKISHQRRTTQQNSAMDPIPMKSVEREPMQPDNDDNDVPLKKSRIRIRQNFEKEDPEVNV